MNEHEWWAQQFEENRGHLRAVAYRILGSVAEADDAVQEAWLRLSRSDPAGIENLGGWLTTVVARVCLDRLRSRSSRREDALDVRERLTVEFEAARLERLATVLRTHTLSAAGCSENDTARLTSRGSAGNSRFAPRVPRGHCHHVAPSLCVTAARSSADEVRSVINAALNLTTA